MNKGNTYNKHMPVLINASSILYEGGGSILEDYLNELFLKVYPVGTIYTSTSDINPTEYFGGTWEIYGSGKCLVGVDASQTEFNTSMKSGGSKSVTLNLNQIPSHYHNMADGGRLVYWDSGLNQMGDLNYGGNKPIQTTWNTRTAYSGGGQAHTNLQPYITVYFWRRTA